MGAARRVVRLRSSSLENSANSCALASGDPRGRVIRKPSDTVERAWRAPRPDMELRPGDETVPGTDLAERFFLEGLGQRVGLAKIPRLELLTCEANQTVLFLTNRAQPPKVLLEGLAVSPVIVPHNHETGTGLSPTTEFPGDALFQIALSIMRHTQEAQVWKRRGRSPSSSAFIEYSSSRKITRLIADSRLQGDPASTACPACRPRPQAASAARRSTRAAPW